MTPDPIPAENEAQINYLAYNENADYGHTFENMNFIQMIQVVDSNEDTPASDSETITVTFHFISRTIN